MNWYFIKLMGIVIFFQLYLLEKRPVIGKETKFCKVGRESIEKMGKLGEDAVGEK